MSISICQYHYVDIIFIDSRIVLRLGQAGERLVGLTLSLFPKQSLKNQHFRYQYVNFNMSISI